MRARNLQLVLFFQTKFLASIVKNTPNTHLPTPTNIKDINDIPTPDNFKEDLIQELFDCNI